VPGGKLSKSFVSVIVVFPVQSKYSLAGFALFGYRNTRLMMRCFVSFRESFFVRLNLKPKSLPSTHTMNCDPVTTSLELNVNVDFFPLAISPNALRKLTVGPTKSVSRVTDVARAPNAIFDTVGGAE